MSKYGFLARSVLGLACLLPARLVAAPPSQNTETAEENKLRFELLPRSLQKNPLLRLTVVTEMTAEGKKRPPPSSAQPFYYVTESAGFRAVGQGPSDRQLPKAEELAATLHRALAVNGYLPATPAHPPTLLLVYSWGAHSNLEGGSAAEGDIAIPDINHKNLLSRAALVGGTKFAEELHQALEQQDLENLARELSTPHEPNDVSDMIAAMSVLTGSIGPLAKFVNRDTKTRQLFDAARADCYYLVASAYDYDAAARGERRLLWRTKMTVDSQSVAMRDTLPALIVNAGEYLGVDMPEAATMSKRLKDGTVTLGPLEVLEYSDRPFAPPAGKAKP